MTDEYQKFTLKRLKDLEPSQISQTHCVEGFVATEAFIMGLDANRDGKATAAEGLQNLENPFLVYMGNREDLGNLDAPWVKPCIAATQAITK